MDLAKGLLNKDKRAAARMITMVENNNPEAIEILSKLYSHTGKGKVIGITGPPGAGKSTLTDKFTKELRKQGKTVAIIAVDPTSPFTGGSILGDRVRMTDLYTDPGVFIRSMGTRGHLGGLSKATLGAVKVLDILGYDYIFIETVGVGQSEVDIVKASDAVLMVMVPGLGDDIQAIKAGIMEIGDIFLINKSDREGADRTKVEIEMMLDYSHRLWRPSVLKVEAINNIGIQEAVNKIHEYFDYLNSSEELDRKRRHNLKMEIIDLTQQSLLEKVMGSDNEAELNRLASEVMARRLDPYTASGELISRGIKY